MFSVIMGTATPARLPNTAPPHNHWAGVPLCCRTRIRSAGNLTRMTLPVGVSTATVTFGGDTTLAGLPARAELWFTPTIGLVHVSGQRLGGEVEGRADYGETGSVTLLHTNQPGLVDFDGNTVTSFAYRVTGWYYTAAGRMRHVDKPITLPVGQTTVDLDAIPAGEAVPVTAPGAVVTSVAGQTGEVTTGELEQALHDAGWAKVIVADTPPPEPADPDTEVWVAPL